MLKQSILFLVLFSSLVPSLVGAAADPSLPNDDYHNHDGGHPPQSKNCGSNYMLPGEIARLGSHSFIILGADGENHVIASHRSGTPPHNYQFLLRVRLDKEEMIAYREILKGSKTLPAFTTIYFDEKGKQLDRTFFCLFDLPKIFGDQKRKGDEFEKLFPIRASLQKNPDHEGGFEIEPSVVRGKYLTLLRDDVELVVYRYLPSYLPQDALRKAIKEKGDAVVSLFSHSPISADERVETASKRKAYARTDGAIKSPDKFCPRNFYLKAAAVPETIHTFLLMAELDKNTVLATHFYDMAPHNFQTALKVKLSDDEMKLYRLAKKDTAVPPMLQTHSTFCMENVRELVKEKKLAFSGTVFKDSGLNEYRLGQRVGDLSITSSDVEVLVNRRLESLMDPIAVANDVRGQRTNSTEAPVIPTSPSDY